MSTIRVVRKKTSVAPGATRIYIGRPSVLGNPFSHLEDSAAAFRVRDRASAIAAYEAWLEGLPRDSPQWREIQRIAALEGDVELACWCAPQPCHGEVIARRIAEIRGEK